MAESDRQELLLEGKESGYEPPDFTKFTPREWSAGLRMAIETTPERSAYAWVNPDAARALADYLAKVHLWLESACDEGRNVLPDATDDQANVIEAWAREALNGPLRLDDLTPMTPDQTAWVRAQRGKP